QPHWPVEQWQDLIVAERSLVLVARSGERLLGGLAVQHLFEEAEVLTMMVAEASRRQGIGMALLEAMLARLGALGVRQVFLEVRAGNDAAQALYACAGFTPLNRRRGYYPALTSPGREDAVVMRRDLF